MEYYAIAMTLFDGDLDGRYEKENKNLTTITILSIFKQAVKGLKYLNYMDVVHNDLKPQNIFLRDSNVFIGGKYIKTHYHNPYRITQKSSLSTVADLLLRQEQIPLTCVSFICFSNFAFHCFNAMHFVWRANCRPLDNLPDKVNAVKWKMNSNFFGFI